MYQFLHTSFHMAGLITACELYPYVGDAGRFGSAQCFGKDPVNPDVILFYPNSDPKVTDPHRLFILEKTAFKYKEIV